MTDFPTTTPTPGVYNTAQTVVDEIQQLNLTIKGLWADLQSILHEISAHYAARPNQADYTKQDDDGNTVPDVQAFQAALGKWQGELNGLNSKLAAVQKKMDDAQKELYRLQSHELPEAQAEDLKNMQEDLDRFKKHMEDEIEAFNSSVASTGDDNNEDVEIEIRRLELNNATDPTLRQLLSAVSLDEAYLVVSNSFSFLGAVNSSDDVAKVIGAVPTAGRVLPIDPNM